MKYLIMLLLCSVLLSGCNLNHSILNTTIQSPSIQSTTDEAISDTIEQPSPSSVASSNPPQVIDSTPDAKSTFSILVYSGNSNADGFIVTEFEVEALNTETLIRKLIEVNALAEGTEVVSEKIEGTCLHLDLNTVFANQVCSTGTAGERMVVGSLVNTFLENYKDTVQTVRFTINGEVLESGHVIYDFELSHFD